MRTDTWVAVDFQWGWNFFHWEWNRDSFEIKDLAPDPAPIAGEGGQFFNFARAKHFRRS